jgi:uncharacterized protein YjbI with pentapeptide repeats
MVIVSDDYSEGVIGKVRSVIITVSLWWSLPIVLLLITIWFTKKHNPFLTYLIGIAPIIGVITVFLYWCNYNDITVKNFLKKNYKAILFYFFVNPFLALLPVYVVTDVLDYYKSIKLIINLTIWSFVIVSILLVCRCLYLLYSKLKRVFPKNEGKSFLFSYAIAFSVFWLIMAIPSSNKGEFLRVNLSYQKLVTEPSVDYAQVYWGDLSGIHLEGASLNSTVLKRADLSNSHLQNANMNYAVLQGANLERANLQGALLTGSNLQEASLYHAYLQGSYFYEADLRKAVLTSADLQGATLMDTNLQEANLDFANLTEAYLPGADLRRASLAQTKLEEANLKGAKLRGAKNLTIEQLSKVKTLYSAELDSKLMAQVEECCPHLRDEPKKARK